LKKKQNNFKIDENLGFFTFLVNGNLKFIYELLTSSLKVIIYQSFNLKVFFRTIPPINFNNIFVLFNTVKFFKLCIQHTINSTFSTMMV